MPKNDTVWQTADLTKTYLEGVRGGIPLAQEQLDVMMHLIRAAGLTVHTFLDLGCGDGILGHCILDAYPQAHGLFLDFSQPMLQAAKERLRGRHQATFVQTDYGRKTWAQSIQDHAPFDAIVSGFSIHHQPYERQRQLYQEIYHLLKPGGIFLNLEHVASRTKWGEARFEAYFIDSLYAYHQRNGSQKTRQQIANEYYNRSDKEANILALVETQCDWLRQIGFGHVDCFLKIFELALFGGIKPN